MTSVGIKPEGLTKAHLLNANIPADYWDIDFSSYEGPEAARGAALSYLHGFKDYMGKGQGLIFAGKVGVGKTSLMAITFKYILRAGWSCYMTSLSELIEQIKRSWDNKDTSQIDICKTITFLGIDDLGKEHAGPTGFSAVTFDNLLRYRVQHRMPTFFTTNLDRKEILAKYGEATLSLIEGKTKVIPVNGPDYRIETQKLEITH